MITLANSFYDKGYDVDIVVLQNKGHFIKSVNNKITIIDLSTTRVLFAIYPLARYFYKRKPNVVLSALTHVNLISIIARFLYVFPLRLVVSEHAVVSAISKHTSQIKTKLFPLLIRVFYRYSDHVVAVSSSVANDILSISKIDSKRISKIYNPIDFDKLCLSDVNRKVGSKYQIIGVGRMSPEKDFPTLIKAFYYVKKSMDVHLIILGEGEEYDLIDKLIRKYELGDHVSLYGFVDNPELYIKQSDILCVTSISEGFCNVVVEALALGTSVITTDCGGPREILENGLHGVIVPVGDFKKLAIEIVTVLSSNKVTPPVPYLESRFGVSVISDKYLEVLIK